MPVFRKMIARRFWFSTLLLLLLQVQAGQVMACVSMLNMDAPADSTCFKHGADNPAADEMPASCCDASHAPFMQSGHCDNDHLVLNRLQFQESPGPENAPAGLAVLVTVTLLFPEPQPIQNPPADRKSPRSGTQTYLDTQRLRI